MKNLQKIYRGQDGDGLNGRIFDGAFETRLDKERLGIPIPRAVVGELCLLLLMPTSCRGVGYFPWPCLTFIGLID